MKKSEELSIASTNIFETEGPTGLQYLNNSLFETGVDPESLSVDVLSFVGDAVYSLFFRIQTLKHSRRRSSYHHSLTAQYVKASGQSEALKKIDELLLPEDRAMLRRGYNSKGAKKHGDNEEYRRATGLEALVGYLFLKGEKKHLKELFEKVIEDVPAR